MSVDKLALRRIRSRNGLLGGYKILETEIRATDSAFCMEGSGIFSPGRFLKLRSLEMGFPHSEAMSACYNVLFFLLKGLDRTPPNRTFYYRDYCRNVRELRTPRDLMVSWYPHFPLNIPTLQPVHNYKLATTNKKTT